MLQFSKEKLGLSKYLGKVTVQDLDSNSQQYFRVLDFPQTFNIGKNSFRLSANTDTLVVGANVYIEVVDSNDNALYYEVLDFLDQDKSRIIVVHVYEDIAPGDIKIYIASRAAYDPAGKPLYFSNTPSSPLYKHNPNLIWVRKASVNINTDASSKIIHDQYPTVKYEEVRYPLYNFTSSRATEVTASFNSYAMSYPGRTYLDSFDDPTLIKNTSKLGDRSFTLDPKQGNQINQRESQNRQNVSPFAVPTTISITGSLSIKVPTTFTFIKDMVGGTFYVKNISTSDSIPSNYTSSFEVFDPRTSAGYIVSGLPVDYSASILKVVNSTTIEVDPPFSQKVIVADKDGKQREIVINRFEEQTNFSASYLSLSGLQTSNVTQSFTKLIIGQAEPAAGSVEFVEVKAKPFGSVGEFQDVGLFKIEKQDILVDNTTIQAERFGIVPKRVGYIESASDLSFYWKGLLYSGSNTSTATFTPSPEKILGGFTIDFTSRPINYYAAVQPANTISTIADTEYELKVKSFTKNISNTQPQLDIYISGSSIKSGKKSNANMVTPMINSDWGTYVGSVFGDKGGAQTNTFNFIAEQDREIIPIFVPRFAEWTIGDIELSPRNELGFSPNHIELRIPSDQFPQDIELVTKLRYLNSELKPSNVESILHGLVFTGSHDPNLQGAQGTQGIQGRQGIQGTQGTQGIAGGSGTSGSSGTQGTQGIQGRQGTQGTRGIFGGNSVNLFMRTTFGSGSTVNSSSLTTAGDFAFQSSVPTPSSSFTNTLTQVIYRNDDLSGNNIGSWLDDLTNANSSIKSHLRIFQEDNSLVYALFEVNSLVTSGSGPGTLRIVNVNFIGGGGFYGATNYVHSFSRSGNSGSSGAGTQGTQGTTGTQGTVGASGSQGLTGTQGIQGRQGTQGTTGTQGTQGIIGASGSQGLQGIVGASGSQGIQGTVGASGSQGVQGTQGLQGIQGTVGASGSQGLQGTVGAFGSQGLTGTQGIQGTTGTQGLTGFASASNGLQVSSSIAIWGDDTSGSTQPARLLRDRYINQSGSNIIFVGADSATSQSLVKIKSDGTIEQGKVGATDLSGYYPYRLKPLQTGYGNTDFVITKNTTINPSGSKNNETVNIGFNLGPGGGPDLFGETGMGLSFENHYAPTAGQIAHEFHLFYLDEAGVQFRPLTMYMDKVDKTRWSSAFHTSTVEFRPYNDLNPYFRVAYRESSTPSGSTQVKILSPLAGNIGAYFEIDPVAMNFQICNLGMTSPSLYMNTFAATILNMLFVQSAVGLDSTKLLGLDSSKGVEYVTTSSNLSLISNVLDIAVGAKITGSLQGSSSYALNALSASWAPGGSSLPSGLLSGSVQIASDISGSSAYSVYTRSASYSEANTFGEHIILVNASASLVNITLPTAVNSKAKFTFKKIDSGVNVVNIISSGSQGVDSQATQSMLFQNTAFTIISDNTNWWRIN